MESERLGSGVLMCQDLEAMSSTSSDYFPSISISRELGDLRKPSDDVEVIYQAS
jgi:hypothetical protein